MKTQRVVRPEDKGCPPHGPVLPNVVRPTDNNNNDWSAPRTSEFIFEGLCCPPHGHLKSLTRREGISLEARNKASGGRRPKTTRENPCETASVRRLLRALVDRCIAGDCDHGTAAKMLGVRRATFDEQVRAAKVERRVHHLLVAAFHLAFPECNPRNYRGDPRRVVSAHDRPRNNDNLLRSVPDGPCVTYTAEEAASLPASQPSLLLADPNALNEWSRHPIGRKRNNRDEENGLSCDNDDREMVYCGAADDAGTDDDEADWTALEISSDEFEFAA